MGVAHNIKIKIRMLEMVSICVQNIDVDLELLELNPVSVNEMLVVSQVTLLL